jgi:hypothetical protein
VDGTLGWRSILPLQTKDAMTLASVATIFEGPLTDALIAALEHANEPMAVTKLAQIIPLPYKKQKSRFESILQELVAQGRAHGFPPFRSRQPRYWTKDQDHYARALILNLLVEKGPSRPAEVEKPIKSRLKSWPKDRLTALQKVLIQEGKIRELPPLGKTKVRRLSLKPPEPREYLEKLFAQSLVKPLAKVIAQLHQEGAAPEQLLGDANAIWQETLEKMELFACLKTIACQDRRAEGVNPLMSPSHQGPDVLRTSNPELTALMQGMLTLKPNSAQGAMVAIPDLRNYLRDAFAEKEEFDRAVLKLAETGRIDLHRHTFPASLDDSERAALVKDERGNYFIGIVLRR